MYRLRQYPGSRSVVAIVVGYSPIVFPHPAAAIFGFYHSPQDRSVSMAR